MNHTAIEIEETLLAMRDDKQRAVYMRFFKTKKGQYGEGDQFLGIKNPQVRLVVKEAWKETSLEDCSQLIHSPWHEVRLCGLLIMAKYMEKAVRRRDESQMQTIFSLYTSLHERINNWDLVDLSATIIAGHWEVLHPEETLLDDWIASPDSTLWQKRIAMVSCWRLVRYGRYDETMRRAEMLIYSREDLLHKAAGWMLREMGKASAEGLSLLRDFLELHAHEMPSVMLRYAIEKMDNEERLHFLSRYKKIGNT